MTWKIFAKRDCGTCAMLAPVFARLVDAQSAQLYVQDDPDFYAGAIDDTALEQSFHHDIEVTPTTDPVRGRQGSRTYLGLGPRRLAADRRHRRPWQ